MGHFLDNPKFLILFKSCSLLLRMKNYLMECFTYPKAHIFVAIFLGYGQICVYGFGKDLMAMNLAFHLQAPFYNIVFSNQP